MTTEQIFEKLGITPETEITQQHVELLKQLFIDEKGAFDVAEIPGFEDFRTELVLFCDEQTDKWADEAEKALQEEEAEKEAARLAAEEKAKEDKFFKMVNLPASKATITDMFASYAFQAIVTPGLKLDEHAIAHACKKSYEIALAMVKARIEIEALYK